MHKSGTDIQGETNILVNMEINRDSVTEKPTQILWKLDFILNIWLMEPVGQSNKEQIWNALVQSNDALMASVRRASEEEVSEFKGARDRVINASLQINSLFLTGWIALLSVGKLSHSCEAVFYSLLFVGCGLHVIVFSLVLGSQWKTMRLHFNSQIRIGELEKGLRTAYSKKRAVISNCADVENIGSILHELNELDRPAIDLSGQHLSSYENENGVAWRLGKRAMFAFFVSMVFSLVSFLILINP